MTRLTGRKKMRRTPTNITGEAKFENQTFKVEGNRKKRIITCKIGRMFWKSDEKNVDSQRGQARENEDLDYHKSLSLVLKLERFCNPYVWIYQVCC